MNVELVQQKFEASWTSYAAMLGNGGSVSAADLCMVRRLILRLVPLIYADHEKEGDYPSYLGFRIVDAAGRDDFAATALTFARLEAGKKYGIGAPSEVEKDWDWDAPREQRDASEVEYLLAMRYEVCVRDSPDDEWTVERWFRESDDAENYHCTLCGRHKHVKITSLNRDMTTADWFICNGA